MDCSTNISDKTNCTETDDLSNGELSERYYLLKNQFDNLSCSIITAVKQELVEDGKLMSELDLRISSLQEEISQFKEDRAETADRRVAKIKSFENKMGISKKEQAAKLSKQLEAAQNLIYRLRAETTSVHKILEESRAKFLSLQQNIMDLTCEMDKWRMLADLRHKQLQAAREQEVATLADLDKVTDLLQQQINSQDAQCHSAEGHSVFPEVEDMEMAKNLVSTQQANSRLLRELADKHAEVQTLSLERERRWEKRIGAASDCNNDELIKSFVKRITQLEDLCEQQKREQVRWLAKLSESSANDSLPWDLEHLRSEFDKLHKEVSAKGDAQLTSAAQVQDLQRQLGTLTVNSAEVRSPDDSANREESEGVMKIST